MCVHVSTQVHVSDAARPHVHQAFRGLMPVATHTARLPGGAPAVGQGSTSLGHLHGLLEGFHSLSPKVSPR